MNLLIVGDPSGLHSLVSIQSGWNPENIFVWDNNDAHKFRIKQINDKITIVDDFFNLNMRFTMAIGNPPYGAGGNLAIKFLNKTSELTDDIRFVLPVSVRKPSSLNKIDKNIEITEDYDLDSKTFPNGIVAVYQRWQRTNIPRRKIEMLKSHPDFEFLPYERRFEADVFVGEYGSGPSGKVKTENFTHYAKGHHFLKVRSPEVIDNLLRFAPKFREVSSQCNGRRHFGKNDLISTYIECLNEEKQA
jgi:hypothetical protein